MGKRLYRRRLFRFHAADDVQLEFEDRDQWRAHYFREGIQQQRDPARHRIDIGNCGKLATQLPHEGDQSILYLATISVITGKISRQVALFINQANDYNRYQSQGYEDSP